jgi:glycosyltransferase involved in cell wall biosynthesis
MNNQTAKISLIIAFYNEELYLDRCLQSVVNQTYKNIEVILINDGSTDNSLKVVEKYLNDFFEVKLISIDNSGHAEARNVGLQNATKNHVTFLDADDTLQPNMMQVFGDEIDNAQFDIAICDVNIFADDGVVMYESKWNVLNQKLVNTNKLVEGLYNNQFSENVWAKLFKTKIAKQITFEKNLWFDDRPFLLEYLQKSKSAILIDKKLLNNFRRSTSITRRFLEPKRIIDVYRVFELELNIFKKFNNLNLYKDRIGKFTLDVFMDTFLMQIIDKQNITSLEYVRIAYIDHLEKFKKEIYSQNIKLKLKDKIAIQLLTSPKFFGWEYVNLLVSILKKERIVALKKLKNS